MTRVRGWVAAWAVLTFGCSARLPADDPADADAATSRDTGPEMSSERAARIDGQDTFESAKTDASASDVSLTDERSESRDASFDDVTPGDLPPLDAGPDVGRDGPPLDDGRPDDNADLADGTDAPADVTADPASDCSVVTCGLVAITISPASPWTVPWATIWLHASGVYADSSTEDLTNQVVWTTSEPAVAVVDNDLRTAGIVTGRSVGTATIRAELAGVFDETIVPVLPAQPVSLELLPLTPKLPQGRMRALTAVLTREDGSTQDVTPTAIWSSTDISVASVSADGSVNGVMPGTTTITARMGSLSTTLLLAVTTAMPQFLGADAPARTMPVGLTQQLTAWVSWGDGTTDDVTSQATWTSSDSAHARVSDASGTKGSTTALSGGHADITASFAGLSWSIPMEVTTPTLQRVDVQRLGENTIVIGMVRGLEAIAYYSDASSYYVTGSVAWSSPDTNIATIDGPSVRGEGPGHVQITATYGGVVGATDIFVRADELQGILLLPMNPTITKIGDSVDIGATGYYYAGNEDNLTRQVGWSSSDPAVAIIANFPPIAGARGRITARGIGSSTIRAHYAGYTQATTVTVTAVGDASSD